MTNAKLITILCGNELEDRLWQNLKLLGVSGYSVVKCDGRGRHGPRKLGVVDGSNVRLEILVRASEASRVIVMLEEQYDGDALTAFMVDVEALPRASFGG